MFLTDSFNLYDFYKEMNRDGIVFCYSGPISQSAIEGIGHTLKLNLEIKKIESVTSQALYTIFIEQMQNILNYSADRISQDKEMETELRMGIIVIGKEEDDFYVYCGNKILISDVETLQGKIDELIMLDREQLKALYRERRKLVPTDSSKGAGLGLIEIARKAGKPIDYAFRKIDNQFSFFSIKVMVSRRK